MSSPLPSSTAITPSLPACSIASDICFPISESLFAAIVPTCSISFFPETLILILTSSFVTASTAFSIPRLIPTGFDPATRHFNPSVYIASDNIVAVVVPSPAMSLVLDATSLTSCAPIFSYVSSSSSSFATVTPSFVIVGEPKLFSIITFLPFGPIVILTAPANLFIPLFMAIPAS